MRAAAKKSGFFEKKRLTSDFLPVILIELKTKQVRHPANLTRRRPQSGAVNSAYVPSKGGYVVL